MPVEKIFKIKQEGSDILDLSICDDGLFMDLSYNLSNFAIIDSMEVRNLIDFLQDVCNKLEEKEKFMEILMSKD